MGGRDRPIYAESRIYALFRPNATHGAVAGEYLDAGKAILEEGMGCYKPSNT
jgi:hypothetical protein